MQSYHIFKKKSIIVLSGEHMVHVVVADLDSVTISMLCYFHSTPSTNFFMSLAPVRIALEQVTYNFFVDGVLWKCT